MYINGHINLTAFIKLVLHFYFVIGTYINSNIIFKVQNIAYTFIKYI